MSVLETLKRRGKNLLHSIAAIIAGERSVRYTRMRYVVWTSGFGTLI